MDEEIKNPELKEILAIDPEDMNEEELEIFVESFMDAKLIIPVELLSAEEKIKDKSDEEIALDEEIDFEIYKLEDEEGNEFIPVLTDDEEVEKLDFNPDGIVLSTEDLANLLYESDNERIEGLLINPFTERSAEIPLISLFELFDLAECDDPDCDNPHHHHEHEHEHDHKH